LEEAVAERPSREPGGPIRVLLVDDQEMVRDGLGAVLSSAPDIEMVGEAGDGRQAVALAERLRPDVVVMDIRMPGMDGLTATGRILGKDGAQAAGAPAPAGASDPPRPGEGVPRVLILTTFDLDEYVYQALRAGASGFLGKGSEPEELLNAIRVAAAGDALRGHEFHRTVLDPPGAALRLSSRFGEAVAGHGSPNLLASYLHVHLGADARPAERLVGACLEVGRGR
jgi:DNA-binding NarL/FixJ family response regulator